MNVADVCDALGLSLTEVVWLIEDGELRITEESVEAYIARKLPSAT